MPELELGTRNGIGKQLRIQLDIMKKIWHKLFSSQELLVKNTTSHRLHRTMELHCHSAHMNIPSSIMHDEMIPAVQKDKKFNLSPKEYGSNI